MSTAAFEEEDLDLASYEPPAALTEVSGIESRTIVAIIQSSLDNIRQQVALEKQQREAIAEATAAQQAAEAEAEAKKGKGKAPEAWSNIPDIVLLELPVKSQKHSRFGLRRILNHIRDRSGDLGPESSAAGATRPRLEDTGSTSLTRLVYKHIKSSVSTEDVAEQVECVSCLEDIPPKDGVKTRCHYYCKECFQQLITISLQHEEQWPPKCCLNRIPERIIAKNVAKDLFKQYKEKAEEYEIPIQKRVYCAEADCGEWLRKIDRANSTARCTKGHIMCVICRSAAHPRGEGCPDDHDRRMADQLAEEEGWRRCISCKILVEHKEACQHMTCRCGAEFCYVCGARWRTCDCSMEQLHRLKERAAVRRAERQKREDTEEEWLQEALRAIEAAQREQERQDEIRQAELTRRREAKYAALRGTMLQFNDVQEVTMLEDQAGETDDLGKATIRRRDDLAQKHKAQRQEFRAASEVSIANAELEWQRELRERALWSRQLEDEYCLAQKRFWAQFKGGEAQLRQVLFEYRQENFERYEGWCRWRDSEMGHFRWKIEDDRAIKEEALDTLLQRFENDAAGEALELKRRHAAEARWFQLAVAERTRLLSEFEMIEAETGGDEDLEAGTAWQP